MIIVYIYYYFLLYMFVIIYDTMRRYEVCTPYKI